MKRLGLTLLTLSMVSGLVLAQSNEVTSVNVVGYTKKSLPPGGRIIVGMPFDNLSNGGTNTLLSLFGTNQLTKAVNYVNADRISIFDPAQTRYQTYAMYIDGVFYKCNNGSEWNSNIVANATIIPNGSAFWIVRAGGAATTNDITIMGQVVSVVTQQVGIVSGYQLVSYPFSSGTFITNLNTTAMTKANNYVNADRIVTWETDHYQTYGLYTDGKWYKCNSGTEWNNSILATRALDIAEGIWFIGKANFTWSETNKYLGNL
jgi:hypothetical protein